MKIKVLIIILFLGLKLQSQNLRVLNIELIKKDSTFYSVKDSVFLKGEKNKDTIYIEITNTKKNEINLFSTYFNDNYINSPYLRRVDNDKKQIKLSYLPLIPYLSPIKSDLIIYGSNAIINKSQLGYNFIEIPPFSILKIKICFNELIGENFFKDFDIFDYNVFSTINWKKIKNKNKFNKYLNLIEFAIYEDVSLLKSQHDFFENTKTYDDSSKKYKTLTWTFPKD